MKKWKREINKSSSKATSISGSDIMTCGQLVASVMCPPGCLDIA